MTGTERQPTAEPIVDLRRPLSCGCPDWKPNSEKLNAPFGVLYARNPDTYRGYDGKRFEFCPWCGKQLQELVIVP